MQYDTMVMFNMTELPIKEEHVAWNVVKDTLYTDSCAESYVLYEIVKATYRHPDAKYDMTITNLEERCRGKMDSRALHASPYIVFYHAQQTIAMVARSS
jgi:hypothetical protein